MEDPNTLGGIGQFFVDVLLPIGTWAIPVTLVLMLLGMLWGMIQNPRAAIKSVAGLAVVVVIFLVAYSSADPTNYSDNAATDAVVKLVSAGLLTLGILIGLTVLSMIVSAVWDVVK